METLPELRVEKEEKRHFRREQRTQETCQQESGSVSFFYSNISISLFMLFILDYLKVNHLSLDLLILTIFTTSREHRRHVSRSQEDPPSLILSILIFQYHCSCYSTRRLTVLNICIHSKLKTNKRLCYPISMSDSLC